MTMAMMSHSSRHATFCLTVVPLLLLLPFLLLLLETPGRAAFAAAIAPAPAVPASCVDRVISCGGSDVATYDLVRCLEATTEATSANAEPTQDPHSKDQPQQATTSSPHAHVPVTPGYNTHAKRGDPARAVRAARHIEHHPDSGAQSDALGAVVLEADDVDREWHPDQLRALHHLQQTNPRATAAQHTVIRVADALGYAASASARARQPTWRQQQRQWQQRHSRSHLQTRRRRNDVGIPNHACLLKDVLALNCTARIRGAVAIHIEADDSPTSQDFTARPGSGLNLTLVPDPGTSSGYAAPGLTHLAQTQPNSLQLTGSLSLATAVWILQHANWTSINVLSLSGVTDAGVTGSPFAMVQHIRTLAIRNSRGLRFVMPSSLSTLTQLQSINLRSNGLESIDEGLFAAAPQLTTVDLSANRITNLPDNTFAHNPLLEVLGLHNNALTRVSARVFAGLSNLVNLRLGTNSIRSIEQGAFDDLTRLEQLNMHRNHIASLPSGLFHRTTSLFRLWLFRNNLIFLEADTFSALTNLDLLDLAINSLSELPLGIFDNTTRLKELRLSDCGVGSLHPRIFQHMSSLQLLWLSNNALNHVPSNLFHGLTSLILLDLANNAIGELSADTFVGLVELDVVYMNANTIRKLPPNLFRDTKGLKWIDVHDNELTELPPLLVKGLPALEEVYFSRNAITSLPTGFFSANPRILLFWMDDNQLRSLPRDAFATFGITSTISLRDNFITDIDPAQFHGAVRVQRIDISNNRLTRLPENALDGLSRLSSLRVDRNRLRRLWPQTFATNVRLRHFSCSGNLLTHIPSGLFSAHPDLHTLEASNNPHLTSIAADVFRHAPGLRAFRLSNTAITHLPPTLLHNLTSLEEVQLSLVREAAAGRDDAHAHAVAPSPLITLTGDHLRAMSPDRMHYLALTNVVLTAEAVQVLGERFSLASLFVGWAGLSDDSPLLPAMCSALQQNVRDLSIRFTSITTLHACPQHNISSLHLQDNHALATVFAGPLNHLNASGCHDLHTLRSPSIGILDISDTNIAYSSLLCRFLGTRMLFARRLHHPSFNQAAASQQFLRSCLSRLQVVDVSQNNWLNNLDLVTSAARAQTVLGPADADAAGNSVGNIWNSNDETITERSSAPLFALEGSPVQCRFELIPLRIRRSVMDALVTEIGYTFNCGCAPQFRRQGGQCVPDALTAAELTGIVVAAALFGLALGPCLFAIYRRRQRSRAYRVQLESENELQKRLIEEKDEEVMALKKAWEIGFDELHLVSRIDAGSPGTFGEVWRADWDTVQVAVKILREGIMLMDESTVAEFGREVEFLQHTRHPHVVRFFGAGTTPTGSPFLVLELVAFGSLQSLLRRDLAEVLRSVEGDSAVGPDNHNDNNHVHGTVDDTAAVIPNTLLAETIDVRDNDGGDDGSGTGDALDSNSSSNSSSSSSSTSEPVQEDADAAAVWRLKARLMRDIAYGMAFIHSLGQLHRLRVDRNRLRRLWPQTFATNVRLRHFSCSGNLLTHIPSGLFSAHPDLHTLEASNNPHLTSIAADVFRHAPGLRAFRLSNTAITHLPPTLLHNLTSLEEVQLSLVREAAAGRDDAHAHAVAPSPLITLTGDHLRAMSPDRMHYLALTNVVLTAEAVQVLGERFSLASLFVGWAGLSDDSPLLPAMCSALQQNVRDLSIRFTSITTLHACPQHNISSLHLQDNHALATVFAGPLNHLNASGCHDLHTLRSPSIGILDISDTNIAYSSLLCRFLGTRMLFARRLHHPSFNQAAASQQFLRSCLSRLQVVDVSQNNWLNNLDLVTSAARAQTVLGPADADAAGNSVGNIWNSNDETITERSSAPLFALEGSPVQCRFELIPLRIRRSVMDALVTEIGYTFNCGCAPQFRRQGGQCVPDALTAAELTGIVVAAALFGLALGPCLFAIYRRRQRSRAYRVQLESENELQKRLIEEKDEEVMALKKAWEIGFDELHLVSRIDAGSPGTFGEVWRADWDTVQVAVKILREGIMLMDESTVAEFGREVEFLQHTRHPHVVRFFGAGTTPTGSPFLVLELVAFGSLQSLLRRDLAEVLRSVEGDSAVGPDNHNDNNHVHGTVDDTAAVIPNTLLAETIDWYW
ncbi:TKL protein kinase [Salpingoeca rosetta]|uniref:TKL protein kinase n=1 Tax=Salpingoeca rosetta (strain ATCC 50818 / BSB-021) TaxID=946362 RepID=F2UGN4_SALR5|nr:TKL protein kinase [Salpingoeca rosetta]EGD75784.1 TKL protein kinase [Salpingoeca rosetta]|eukprot:XP_004991705.1 TKL protein kinase [Salpingoeca rosetta]